MPVDTVIRAWTEQEFRDSLDESELAALPPNPAGEFQEILGFNGLQPVEASWVSVVCIGSCVFTLGSSLENCCA
jgi:mersacidin/lichenicidin family type 2 lantibiotic